MLSLKLTLFIVGTSLAFLILCRAIPQIESNPEPAPTDLGDTPLELVLAGEAIFSSERAQCLTCHSLEEDPKARCPNQDGLGQRAGTTQPGVGAARYLVEALYNPNTFVVSGYPSNQMTPVHLAPISLTHDEILALIAFLNSLGGNTDDAFLDEVRKHQDPWRNGLLEPDAGDAGPRLPVFAGDPERGKEAYTRMGCGDCHRLGEEGRDICPDLTSIGSSQPAEYLLESMLDPSAVIVKGYRAVRVLWKDPGRETIIGTPLEWIPDPENPVQLRVGIQEGDVVREELVDLADTTAVGDTVAVIQKNGQTSVVCGELVAGSAEEGVTMRALQEGKWVEQQIPAADLRRVNLPQSPMPSDFSQRITAREVYDLVAYLLTQTGKQ